MSSAADKGPMAHYSRPPVVEVILGVQFDRLPGLKCSHFGAFWQLLGASEWPSVSDAPPLEFQFETFAESSQYAKTGLQMMLNQDWPVRVQIKNAGADQMVQLQNGRLHFNWLWQAGGAYPRYQQVRVGFESTLKRFQEFAASNKLGEFRPNQWEVTYVNHIYKGTIWESSKDWSFFRPLASLPNLDDVIEPENFGGEWHFVIPKQRGRLHALWQHGQSIAPPIRELIVLTLTARGAIEKGRSSTSDILASLDLGHEAIVRSFEKLMTADANKYWGINHVSN